MYRPSAFAILEIRREISSIDKNIEEVYGEITKGMNYFDGVKRIKTLQDDRITLLKMITVPEKGEPKKEHRKWVKLFGVNLFK